MREAAEARAAVEPAVGFGGRWPWELAALPALVVARMLPAEGAGLYLRLAAATACLLVPGALVSRALGRRGMAPTIAWSLAVLAGACAVMFAVEGSLWLALGLYGAAGAVALPFAVLRPLAGQRRRSVVAWLAVAAAGTVFGIAVWFVAGPPSGDALFHLARVRKLLAFDELGLSSVNEFADGGLHPGYAFPLWHVFLALVSRLGDVDPGAAIAHEAAVLAPLAFLVVYEAGHAVFRTVWGGLAVVTGQLALTGLAAGHGGAFPALALPATVSRHLLVPALVAVFFALAAAPGPAAAATVAAASLGLALVHPTYALFVAVPLGGYVVARALFVHSELGRGALGLAGIVLPATGVALWLLPLVRETAGHDPDPGERARALAHYAGQLDVFSLHSFRVAPEVLVRAGPVAVAALVAVPFAAAAARRRWSALVLGGSVALLTLLLLPMLYTPFSDAVSLSQARRAGGFLPFAMAFAGGAAVLARGLSWAAVPTALGAGIAVELVYPGDFGYTLHGGGPALVTWFGFAAGIGAVVVGAVLGRRAAFDDRGPILAAAAVAFVVPVGIYGFTHWSADPATPNPLTAGLIDAVRQVPPGSVVLSDDDTSYWLAAEAPVYVAAAQPGHVADTTANRPYERRDAVREFGRTADPAIVRRFRADYVLVRRERWPKLVSLPLRRAYSDRRYVLYDVGSPRP